MSETNASSNNSENTAELKVCLQTGQQTPHELFRSQLKGEKTFASDLPDLEKGDNDFHHPIQSLAGTSPQPAPKTEYSPVQFDGPYDPDNPSNWSRKYKCFITSY